MELATSTYIPGFFPAFIFIYLFAYFIVFRRWNPTYRPMASSCLISLAHGTPAAVMAALSIMNQPKPGFASQNTVFQNIILDFSISYFLVDLFHYFIFLPSDIIFIAHHLATLFVLITGRYIISYGSFAILVLLVLAEITSFCQNVWTLSNSRRADVPTAAWLYAFVSPFFYTLYTVARGLAAPFFIYKMGIFYLSGNADIVMPRWVWASWLVVIVTGVFISLLWVLNLWSQLIRENRATVEQKME